MVKHIIVVSDNNRDNLTIYTEEPAFVAIAERNDLNSLKQLEEAQKAGIYILMGEEKRYIGQATQLARRLFDHLNMDWWHSLIFFGREDGHLDKSQLDYLEAFLIQEFRQTSFKVTNNTKGNSSWIDKTSKIHADKVWNIAQNILQEVANINLFENSEVQSDLDNEPVNIDYYIQLTNGYKIHGKSARNSYINFFKYLLSDSELRQRVHKQVYLGKPSSGNPLGTKAKFDRKSVAMSVQLEEGLHLLTTLSTKDRQRLLLRFAKQINLSITIHWD
ncbi:GIY-YIG nuclease family protein [Streptococcus suis]|nr:GIY-YIG nuclease family protein [Streptococcus suis]